MVATPSSPVFLLAFLRFQLLYLVTADENVTKSLPRHCMDFNSLPSYGASVGLDSADLFTCPYDNIAGVKCSGQLPIKANLTDVLDSTSTLSWDDVAVFLPYGKDFRGREKVLDWWIDLFALDYPTIRLDLIMVGPSCGAAATTCSDGASSLATHVNDTYGKHIAMHFWRARGPADDGKSRLACKVLHSFIRIYEAFPSKKYLLKIDDDTVWFPHRLLRFLSTLDRVHESGLPMYFGSVLNGHKPIELCGAPYGPVVARSPPHQRLDDELQRKNSSLSYDVCVAGGAMYGMNWRALAAFINVTLCTVDMDLEYDDEDGWVGFHLYRTLHLNVIHCSAFRPHWWHHEAWYGRAVNYHRVNNDFVNTMNVTALLAKYDLRRA